MSTPRKHGTPRRKSARLSGLPPRLTPRKTTPWRTPRKTPAENAEPIQNEQGGEEGITVAIRMRPLNTKESNANRVWRVLPQYNSITQTTNTGQPLPERVTGRTFFNFDKTFGENAETIDVYNSVAKGIVESVVSGLNGTIFAYGQTSSGKTYTMQGSGSIEEGYSNGGGGIVHMAANDIFTHVENSPDRIFLIRASFIEIYNEEVRDLLGENAVLAVREDPRRGVFVTAVEEIVTDFESLLCILFEGEKNRAVAATGMNERSSRSHTIFRVTIESRKKTEESDENDMGASNSSLPIDDDGAVLISTLNLVDLAGSESVRHTGSTGERQKEGGKINQSLLTLSRVIVGLGQPNQAHINFRDSKLTRILQPSLSGNARMAVICCATPSELYLEETRSTLLFASRAKLVKTRAQVNEVLDDRSLIKRLQRELAEARQQSQGLGQLEHLKALETKASNAGAAARDAEKKLNKLKSSILNHTVVFKSSRSESSNTSKKRRLSDGIIAIGSKQLATPPKQVNEASSPRSVPQAQKRAKTIEQRSELPVSLELEIIKEAHNAKVKQTKKLEDRVGETEKKIFDVESSLSQAVQTISELKAEKEEAVEESQHLSSEISSLFTEMQAATLRYENTIAAKDAAISEWIDKLKMEQSSKQSLEESMNALMEEFESLKENFRTSKEQAMADSLKAAEEKSHLEDNIRLLSSEKSALVEKIEQKESEQVVSKQEITELKSENQQLQGRIDSLSEERVRSAFEVAQVNSERENLAREKEAHQQQIKGMSAELSLLKATMGDMVEEKTSLATKLNNANQALSEVTMEKQELVQQVTELTDAIEHQDSSIETLKERLLEIETNADALTTNISLTESKLGEATSQVASLTSELEIKAESITNLQKALHDAGEKYDNDLTKTKTLLENALVERDELKADVLKLNSLNSSVEEELNQLRSKSMAEEHQIERFSDEVKCLTAHLEFERKENEKLTSSLETCSAERDAALSRLESVTKELEVAENKIETFKATIVEVESDNETLKSQVVAVLAHKSSTEEKLASLEASAGETGTRLAEALAHVDVLQGEKQGLSENFASREAIYVSKLEELHNTQTSLEEALKQVASLKSAIAEMESDREALKSQLEVLSHDKSSTEEKVHNLETSMGETEIRLAEALAHIDTLQGEKQGLSENVATREADYASKVEELQDVQTSLEEAREQIASLKSAITEMESNREALRFQLEVLSHDKSSTEEKVANLETSVGETENRLAEALAHSDTLQAEKQRLSEEVAAREADYISKLEELQYAQTSLEEALEQNASLKSDMAEIESDCEALRSLTEEQVASFRESKEEAESRLAEARTQITMFQTEIQKMSENVAELQKAQVSLKEAHAQIETLKATIAETELQASEMDLEAMKLKLQEADAEANELKQLLAAANDSVNEAREAALAAEDELQEKDKKLEESLQQLFQSEKELRLATDKLSRLEDQVSSSADKVNTEQVEVLLGQVAAAEAHLESERRERTIAEEELKRIMAEKQRALVQEAEDKLAGLKKEILDIMSSRSSAEAEAYSLRQEMEDLQDQNKRLEAKALEADLLRQSEKRLKDQVSELSEARLALQAELACAKQELASRSKHSEREVVEAIAELSRVKSECYAAKQESIDLEEDVKRLVKENSSSTREVRLLREKSANLDATVFKLEEENHELMYRLRKLEADKIQEQENVETETKRLQSRITELESSIKRKDTRIQKLEAVKLTKEKCKAIERITEERAQFLIAAEDYRAKLTTAEATIAQLQAKVARVSRDVGSTPDGDELASMKFSKEALETKLRKYAAHCQRLENEKASVLDALKAVNGSDIDDGDVTKAVILLCDKHTSLEEECEALMSAEKRASSYLSELDHLREINSCLQKSFSDAESKLAVFANSETDLARKLNEAKEKVELLRKERDHLKALAESERGNVADLESEKSRQIRYLEQENLQLMLDLKNAKKQIKATRAQLDAMRMSVVDDETEDLGSIAADALGATRADGGDKQSPDSSVPLSPVDKENLHANAAGRGAEKTHGTESSRKRRFASVNRSAKKVRKTASRTLGLGEASVNEDQTGECKQS